MVSEELAAQFTARTVLVSFRLTFAGGVVSGVDWFSFLNDQDAICLSLLLSLVRTFSTRCEGFWHEWKRFLFFINEVAEKNRNMALLSDILALGQKNAQER